MQNRNTPFYTLFIVLAYLLIGCSSIKNKSYSLEKLQDQKEKLIIEVSYIKAKTSLQNLKGKTTMPAKLKQLCFSKQTKELRENNTDLNQKYNEQKQASLILHNFKKVNSNLYVKLIKQRSQKKISATNFRAELKKVDLKLTKEYVNLYTEIKKSYLKKVNIYTLATLEKLLVKYQKESLEFPTNWIPLKSITTLKDDKNYQKKLLELKNIEKKIYLLKKNYETKNNTSSSFYKH